jgi:hypothetical protein
MRPFKIAGMLFILAMAISAFASTAAFALPEILDHVPSTFTATGPEGELLDEATKLNIKCEKLLILLANGKLLTATTIEAVIDFEQCRESLGGFATNSLGDKNDTEGKKLGLILVPVKGESCYIGDPKNKEAGLFLTIPLLHLEVPAVATLLEILTGSTVVALVTPNNKLQTGPYALTTNVKQECDGKKADILMEVEHNKKPLLAVEKTTATITFDEDEELMVV